ncbi:hypothetical protein [Streptococcus catagoni]|uniref:hypothetical protein n=1 Tax=Streptococcus catagoni TaxID=2654874 RepID=UPI00140839F1|nr:hypothetical protein [Streptococcus catagoni]
MKKYLIFFLSLLLLLTGCKNSNNTQKIYKKVNVETFYHFNNKPMYGIHIEAFNYETAFRKIKSGKFQKNDFEHYTFDSVRKQYSVEGRTVSLGKYQFGEGIKNTSNDAKEIIKILFENDLDYLTYMNGLKERVNLLNPDNPRYKFTDKNGKAVGKIESGVSILRDTTGTSRYKLVDIKENSVVYLGNTKLPQKAIILNDKKTRKDISADYGEEITYKIPLVSKDMAIQVSPNFVVDSVSQPYRREIEPTLKKEAQDGNLVDVSGSPTIANKVIKYSFLKKNFDDADIKKADEDLAKSVSKLHSIEKLVFEFGEDLPKEIVIKGHVSSMKNYHLPVIIEKADESIESVNKSIDVYSSSFSQGIYLTNKSGNILTPQVKSYGINFVTLDGKTNKPVSHIDFMLGRIKDKSIEILKKENGKTTWKKTDLSMKELVKSSSSLDPFVFTGNHYTYIDGTRRELPINEDFWIYDRETQKKENQPLFKIRGLSKNYKYFVLPASKTKLIVNQNKPLYFSVNKNTISESKSSNYELNGFISDMKYGKEEYHTIPTLKKGDTMNAPKNPLIKIILILISVFLIYTFTILFVLKKK